MRRDIIGVVKNQTVQMKRGAVAVLDALGMRGIWGGEGKELDQVVESYELLKSLVEKYPELSGDLSTVFDETGQPVSYEWMDGTNLRALMVSDTVVAAASSSSRSQNAECGALVWLGQFLSNVVSLAATAVEPFVFRGIVTTGEFYWGEDSNVFFGPAVDEAAAQYELVEAGIVALSPRAFERFKAALGSEGRPIDTSSSGALRVGGIRWPVEVPMKGGYSMPTGVITPFIGQVLNQRVMEGATKRFRSGRLNYRSSPEVYSKWTRTERLLRLLMTHSEREP